MSPAVYPPVTIEPPQVERLAGGLYSAAPPQPGPVINGDPRRWENGIQYQSETCAQTSTWAVTCGTDDEREVKDPALDFPLVVGTPFVSYLGVQCMLPGRTLEEYRRSVLNALELCEQRSVERTFWTGDMGNEGNLNPGLYDAVTNPDGVQVLEASDVTALGILEGIGALESFLGSNYCGVGVLHTPRVVAPFVDNLNLIKGGTARPTTSLGNRWAFGAGYDVNTGPDGAPAADGTVWIYATGQVNIWRSEIWLQPDSLDQAFNTRNNNVLMFGERTFVITRECAIAGVRVRLDCDC